MEHTRVDAWALPAFAETGYEPDSTHHPECDRHELEHDECTCEICWNANSIANPGTSQPRRHAGLQHLPKTYHTACINGCDGYTPPTGDEDEEWECPACHDLKEHPEHAKPSK
jgi:hypothetical protein